MENDEENATFQLKGREKKGEKRRSSGILKTRPLNELDSNRQNEEKTQKTYRRVSFAKTTSVLEFFKDSPQPSQDSDTDTVTPKHTVKGLEQLLTGKIHYEPGLESQEDLNRSIKDNLLHTDMTVNELFDMETTECLEDSESLPGFSNAATTSPDPMERPEFFLGSPDSPGEANLACNIDARSFLSKLTVKTAREVQMLSFSEDPVLGQPLPDSSLSVSSNHTILFGGDNQMNVTARMDMTECLAGNLSMGLPGMETLAPGEEEETGINTEELTNFVESQRSLQPRQPLQTLARVLPGPPSLHRSLSDTASAAATPGSTAGAAERSSLQHSVSMMDLTRVSRCEELNVTAGEMSGQTWPVTQHPCQSFPQTSKGLVDITVAVQEKELSAQKETGPAKPASAVDASEGKEQRAQLLQGLEYEVPTRDLSHQGTQRSFCGNADNTIIFGQDEPSEVMEMTECQSSIFLDDSAPEHSLNMSGAPCIADEKTVHFGAPGDKAAMELTGCHTIPQLQPRIGVSVAPQSTARVCTFSGDDEKTRYFGPDENTDAMQLTQNFTAFIEVPGSSARGLEEMQRNKILNPNSSLLNESTAAADNAAGGRTISTSICKSQTECKGEDGKKGLQERPASGPTQKQATAEMNETDPRSHHPQGQSLLNKSSAKSSHTAASLPAERTLVFASEDTDAGMDLADVGGFQPLSQAAKSNQAATITGRDRTIVFDSEQTAAVMEETEISGCQLLDKSDSNEVHAIFEQATAKSGDKTILWGTEETAAGMDMTKIGGCQLLDQSGTGDRKKAVASSSSSRDKTIVFTTEHTAAEMEMTTTAGCPTMGTASVKRVEEKLSQQASGGEKTILFTSEHTAADMEVTGATSSVSLGVDMLKKTVAGPDHLAARALGDRTVYFASELTSADMEMTADKEMTQCDTRTGLGVGPSHTAQAYGGKADDASSARSLHDRPLSEGRTEDAENSTEDITFGSISAAMQGGTTEDKGAGRNTEAATSASPQLQTCTTVSCSVTITSTIAETKSSDTVQVGVTSQNDVKITLSSVEKRKKSMDSDEEDESPPGQAAPPKMAKRRSLALDSIVSIVEESKASSSGLKRKIPTMEAALTSLMSKAPKTSHPESVAEAASAQKLSATSTSNLGSRATTSLAQPTGMDSSNAGSQPVSKSSEVAESGELYVKSSIVSQAGVVEMCVEKDIHLKCRTETDVPFKSSTGPPDSPLEKQPSNLERLNEAASKSLFVDPTLPGLLEETELELCEAEEDGSLETERSRHPSTSSSSASANLALASNVSVSGLSHSLLMGTSFLCNTQVDKPWLLEDFMEAMRITSLPMKVKLRKSSFAEFMQIPGDGLWEKLEAVTMVKTQCQVLEDALPRLEEEVTQCNTRRQQLEGIVSQQEPEIFRQTKAAIEANNVEEYNKIHGLATAYSCYCNQTAKRLWKEWQCKLHLQYLDSLKDQSEGLSAAVEELVEADAEYDEDLEKVEQDLLAASEMLRELQEEVEGLPNPEAMAQLSQVSAQLQQEEQEHNECEQQLKTLERELEEVKQALRQENAEYVGMEKQLLQPSTQLPELESDIQLLEDDLKLLQGVTMFRVETLNERCAVVNFQRGLLQLSVFFSPYDSQTISSIKLLSWLPDTAEPCKRLGHELVKARLSGDHLARKYSHRKLLSSLLTEVSLVVAEGRALSQEITAASLRHLVEVDRHRLTVHLWCVETVRKVVLAIDLKLEDYPKEALDCRVSACVGNISTADIQKHLQTVAPGQRYLTRLLSAVQALISTSK